MNIIWCNPENYLETKDDTNEYIYVLFKKAYGEK